MKMPAIMYSCAIEELEEAVDNKRPISSLMKQKWIDDAGGFVGDCETLLRLFRDRRLLFGCVRRGTAQANVNRGFV